MIHNLVGLTLLHSADLNFGFNLVTGDVFMHYDCNYPFACGFGIVSDLLVDLVIAPQRWPPGWLARAQLLLSLG